MIRKPLIAETARNRIFMKLSSVRFSILCIMPRKPLLFPVPSLPGSKSKNIQHAVRADRDALLAVHRERNGICADGPASLKIPNCLSRARVERIEIPFVRTGKYQATGGR